MVSKKQVAEIETVIGQMTLAELVAINKGITARIEELKDAEKERFVAEMRAKAEQLNLNLNDLAPQLGIYGSQRRTNVNGTGERASPPVKYTDGKGNTWSGRGLAPKWITLAIAEGRAKDKSEFLIK